MDQIDRIEKLLDSGQVICLATAARLAGVSHPTIRKWIRVGRKANGKVHRLRAGGWKDGGVVFIAKKDLVLWLRRFPVMECKRNRRSARVHREIGWKGIVKAHGLCQEREEQFRRFVIKRGGGQDSPDFILQELLAQWEER